MCALSSQDVSMCFVSTWVTIFFQVLLRTYLQARKAKLFTFPGKEVHPVLRYRDADGSVFSQITNSFGQTQTQSIFTAAAASSSSPSSSTASDSASSDSRGDSFSSGSGGILRYDSASDSEEEEVASHLQRLQSLAGNWKLKQTNKRARAANKSPQQDDSEESTNGGGPQGQGQASFQLPPVPAMQVYLHGIDEAVLQAALTTSSLWERIQLQDSLQASCSEVLLMMLNFSWMLLL